MENIIEAKIYLCDDKYILPDDVAQKLMKESGGDLYAFCEYNELESILDSKAKLLANWRYGQERVEEEKKEAYKKGFEDGKEALMKELVLSIKLKE